MNLWFRQVTDSLCSWSIVLDGISRAAKDLGYKVVVGNEPPPFTWNWIEIWWGAPQDWRWHSSKVKARVGISLSESDQLSNEYQEEALRNLKQCDILFTPSHFAMRAFLEMPLEMPMHLWPFGVDVDRFVDQSIDFESNPFRFLLLGATQFRKGSWLAAEAFTRAFTPDDCVELTIATFMPAKMHEALAAEYDTIKAIKFVTAAYTNPLIHYDGHHCLLSPHLSEGWGLCIPEAMALGMPCIVSRCSSPREYFSADYGWWIEMSNDYAPVWSCFPNTQGFWRLPDVKDLADKMRYAFEHRSECKQKAAAAAAYAAKYLTWSHGAKEPLAQIEKCWSLNP